MAKVELNKIILSYLVELGLHRLMDKQYYIDNHIGLFKNFMPNKLIDMKTIKGPFASYVNNIGNRGITGFVMIETSHIAIHIWDEPDPALVQFDVYSCADFDV